MAGRPLKFKTVKELQQKIDAYFESCYEDVIIGLDKDSKPVAQRQRVRPFTVTGLAVFLDTSRKTLLEYENKDEFGNTVTRAKNKIEAFVEESLWQPKIATGIAFNLKNNFGWKDKQEIEHSGDIEIVVTRINNAKG